MPVSVSMLVSVPKLAPVSMLASALGRGGWRFDGASSDSVTDSDSDTGSNPVSDPGSDLGYSTGPDAGSDAGSVSDPDPGYSADAGRVDNENHRTHRHAMETHAARPAAPGGRELLPSGAAAAFLRPQMAGRRGR